MAVQITIIGMGQIGASIGLALGQYKDAILRVGHDKKVEVEREAQKKGAVDKAEHNLPSAVKDAKLVVLCVPISQVRETLEFIAPDLQEGTIVLDTAPVKTEVMKWAKELLPEGRYYVGLVPAINPDLLHNLRFGLEAAQADLFSKGLFVIDAPYGTPGEVMTLAADFVRLLGAAPLLADMAESDGLMARTHLLPQLVAAAFLNATIDQPGWQEARKVAGRAYATLTAGLAYNDEIDSLRMAALHNRANVVHALDVMMASLRGLRDDIEKGDDDGVAERLEAALVGRQRWMDERMSADWMEARRELPDIPSFSERLFGSAFVKRTTPEK
ncbi:MAG: prephenate dehydrogenase [Chloroflexi bacterium]|nr:prephenate dehydrogenase [Chloroflexota bacterium]